MDVMLDLETMSNKPNAAIIAIGAVQFDITGQFLGEKFYQLIDLESAVDAGGVMDPDTVLWWLQQSDEARAALNTDSKMAMVQALRKFQKWLADQAQKKDIKVWGNGAAFDNVILTSAYDRLEMMVPWHYWNDRCYRTIKNLHQNIPMQGNGIKHNALNDAENQALHLIRLLNQ